LAKYQISVFFVKLFLFFFFLFTLFKCHFQSQILRVLPFHKSYPFFIYTGQTGTGFFKRNLRWRIDGWLDFAHETLDQEEVKDLFSFIKRRENVLLCGPVGVGSTLLTRHLNTTKRLPGKLGGSQPIDRSQTRWQLPLQAEVCRLSHGHYPLS